MRLIDADALMDYCNNQKSKTIDANDIARFPTAVGWTSVKDRLPEPEEKVLIWTKTECMRYAQYHDDGSKNHWYVYEDGSRAWTNVITHWMPLPEQPKEVKQND